MVSLTDIVPQTREVETAHGTVTLRGLGLRHIAELFLRFPEVRKFFSAGGPEIDVAVLLAEAPDAIAAIIAEAAGQPKRPSGSPRRFRRTTPRPACSQCRN